ncbi:putative RNA-directed DNA polymerase like protein [Argiope bruennichi]|uniref:Putative RNA-directed DNA polymerase like protein n=1 Tax=Argiope bruennichi TaxID=94029 RepID=A0A8T0FHN2_ARGBR|nr:putative RNA-directed DNA polymerase like protein [Argiope bruennichi]
MATYLRGRHLTVRVGSNLSSERIIEAGVVQGSKIGPILFNIYINDIPSPRNCQTQLCLFADDTAIMSTGGIRHKYKELKYLILDWAPDVIAIQETHLRPSDNLKIPNYTSYRTDRLTHKGCGTAILIKNSIPHHPTPISSTSFENTAISIDLPNGLHITLASIYRPPHGKINTSELQRVLNQTTKSIVVGDFNAKHPSWSTGRSNSNGAIIHNFIASNNLILIAPLEPTHFPINAASSSTLDFGIMCNIASGTATSLNELSSDHNPVLFEIDININLLATPKTIKTTNWSVVSAIIKNSIPGNPFLETTQHVHDAISKFTA